MSSGIVVMDLDDDTLSVKHIEFYGYNKIKKRTGEFGSNVHVTHVGTDYDAQSLEEREHRVVDIFRTVLKDVKYAGIEDFAVSKAHDGSSSMIQICEFCGFVRHIVYEMGIGIVNYGITAIKRFATGSGSADKIGMGVSFKGAYPELYPAGFDDLPQFESPMGDMVDAFWMCEILRCHLKFEKFGEESIEEPYLTLLTTSATKGTSALIDSPLSMMGVKYDKPKRKTKKRKKN